MQTFDLSKDFRDLNIESTGVTIAVRDFGGTGDSVVLLHGLGRTLIDWSVIAPLLRPHLRVVAFDLRGHGKSTDGPWSWDLALADIDAVVGRLNLGAATVVGHSLGGMLAVMWANTHPGTRAVNIDGHGRRTLSQFVGIPETAARRRVADAQQRVNASLEALSGPLPPALVEGLLTQQRALAAQFGAPEEMFVGSIARALRREDGATFLRPSPIGLGAEILAAAEAFDMFRLYEGVSGPVLVIAGTEPDPGADPELMAAYRKGVIRDLKAFALKDARLTVDFRPGGHGLLFEDRGSLAIRIAGFLTAR